MDARIAKLREKRIYLGTSSWKYPGWMPWFYRKHYPTQKAFNETCLTEYAENYSAVGVDHTYYDWPKQKMFQKYVELTPEGFLFALKATERSTVLRFPTLPRYGKDAGKQNEHFLSGSVFQENFLRPLEAFSDRLGPILIEFSQFYPGMLGSGREFIERLDLFLEEITVDKRFGFAVEIRNSNWLRPEYFRVLEKHKVSHVFNSWTRMPSLGEQLALAAPFPLPSLVCRALLQPGTKYEEAVEAFSPYDKVVEEQPPLRLAVADLVSRAAQLKLPAYVFVNNRAEGCAPKTIEGILEILNQRSLFDA